MKEKPYFQIQVTKEQENYARSLVEYSIESHPVTDVFVNDPQGKERQYEFRYTGTLGEIVFADAYQLERPTRSFGAVDGQDYGQDFLLSIGDAEFSIDVKSMHRKSSYFLENYVLNIPSYQINKAASITDYYYCVSFHESCQVRYATFLGLVKKSDILEGVIGDLFMAGAKRIRQDGSYFTFMRDTYEIMFRHITPPIITEYIGSLPGYKELFLKPGRRNNKYKD